MSKKIYAITINWYREDENGERRLTDTGISTLAYDNEEDAKAFLQSRCNQVAQYGWKGSTTFGQTEAVYTIRELAIERKK